MEDWHVCWDGYGFLGKLARDYVTFMILSHWNTMFLNADDAGARTSAERQRPISSSSGEPARQPAWCCPYLCSLWLSFCAVNIHVSCNIMYAIWKKKGGGGGQNPTFCAAAITNDQPPQKKKKINPLFVSRMITQAFEWDQRFGHFCFSWFSIIFLDEIQDLFEKIWVPRGPIKSRDYRWLEITIYMCSKWLV